MPAAAEGPAAMANRSTPTYTFSVPGFTRGVKLLILITSGVFVLEWLAQAGLPLVDDIPFRIFYLSPLDVVRHFAFWQPFTYLFIHANFWHLFFNMLGLWMFGVAVEEALGTARFYRLYFISGVGGGLVDIALHWGLQRGIAIPTIGASAAVFGVLLAFGMMFPNQPVFLILPPVSIKAKWLVLAYGVLEFLFAVGPRTDDVSHVAHLGGMLFAFLYLRTRWPQLGLGQQYQRWRRRRMQRRFQVYMNQRDRPNGRKWMN